MGAHAGRGVSRPWWCLCRICAAYARDLVMQLRQSATRGQGASTASWSGLRVLSLVAAPDATVARALLVSERCVRRRPGGGGRRALTGGEGGRARRRAGGGGGERVRRGGSARDGADRAGPPPALAPPLAVAGYRQGGAPDLGDRWPGSQGRGEGRPDPSPARERRRGEAADARAMG